MASPNSSPVSYSPLSFGEELKYGDLESNRERGFSTESANSPNEGSLQSRSRTSSSASGESGEEADQPFDEIEEDEDASIRRIIEEFPVGLLVFNDDNRTLHFINKEACHLLNVKQEESVGKPISTIFYGTNDDKSIEPIVKEVASTGKDSTLGEKQLRTGFYRIKIVQLPNDTVGVLLEKTKDSNRDPAFLELMLGEAINLLILTNGGTNLSFSPHSSSANLPPITTKRIQSGGSPSSSSPSSPSSSVSSSVPLNMERLWMLLVIQQLLTFIDTGDHQIFITTSTPATATVSTVHSKEVSGGDINGLIHKLTSETVVEDIDFVNHFFLTFQYFITPSRLVQRLILRFVSATTRSDLTDEQKIIIQLRTVKCMKTWISSHFYHFINDGEALRNLQNFIHSEIANSKQLRSTMKNLHELILEKLHGLEHDYYKNPESPSIESLYSSAPPPEQKHWKKIDITEISPKVLANQLTFLFLDKFKLIKPMELYAQSWSKEDKDKSSPNVVKLISEFNRICRWMQTEIVACEDFKKRAHIIKLFIDAATECLGYRDLNAVFAVAFALSQTAISRLSQTWKELERSSASTLKQWKKLLWWADYSHNYRNYRVQVKKFISSGKQFLPYLGLYLKDLTFIEDGNKTVLESTSGEGDHNNNLASSTSGDNSGVDNNSGNATNSTASVVNFQKMRMVANIITEIQIAQRSDYSKELIRNDWLFSYLAYGVEVLDEDGVWILSKKCEGGSAPASPRSPRPKESPSSSSDGSTVKNPLFGKQIAQRTRSSNSINIKQALSKKLSTISLLE